MTDGTREPVTGMGQLGLCGPAANGEMNFADDWFRVGPDGQNRGQGDYRVFPQRPDGGRPKD